jgi:hypothetical protein
MAATFRRRRRLMCTAYPLREPRYPGGGKHARRPHADWTRAAVPGCTHFAVGRGSPFAHVGHAR